jgi:hypothetical protein
MGCGIFVDRIEAELNTFGDLLKRYAAEVSPHKKGGAGEILRIRKLRKESLAEYKVAALTSKVMAEYRDTRREADCAQSFAKYGDPQLLAEQLHRSFHCRCLSVSSQELGVRQRLFLRRWH